MAYHRELLDQATWLARKEPRRPKQASLRRAVSSAYYALFHFLIHEATCVLVGRSNGDTRNRHLLGRAFQHGEMVQAAKTFEAGLPNKLSGLLASVPVEIRSIAKAFVELQEQRHSADYDLCASFVRSDVLALIERANQSIQGWQAVRSSPEAKYFLQWLLLGSRIGKR